MNANDTRTNLILALVEENKDYATINEALVKIGQTPLVDSEVIAYGVTLKLDPAALAAEEATMAAMHGAAEQTKPAKAAKPAKKPATTATTATTATVAIDGITFNVAPKFAHVNNDHGVMVASLVADNFLAQASAFLKAALGDEWYTAYKQIKNPGFTKATAETRDLAYAFVLRTLLALKKPVNDAKDKLDKG